MPERPDLEYVVPILKKSLSGRKIAAITKDRPVVLRVLARETAEELLQDATIDDVSRRAHFVTLPLNAKSGALSLVFAPMLAGKFRVDRPAEKLPRDVAMTFLLDDGSRLVFRDDVQMGKVYVVDSAKTDQIPGYAKIGVDVLSKGFTLAHFTKLLRARRDQAKVFLMDKTALDAFGNAYADEALFEARIHPKAFVRKLDDEAIARLHAAIISVLTSARATIATRKPPLDEKLRDFLVVRNRHGATCPRCGSTIRKVGVLGHDAFFCPHCQPDDRHSSIVDFGRLGLSSNDDSIETTLGVSKKAKKPKK
jgi:formamidopyrimidine-DNA glycosylase